MPSNKKLNNLEINQVIKMFEGQGFDYYHQEDGEKMSNFIKTFDTKDRILVKYITREGLVRGGGYLLNSNLDDRKIFILGARGIKFSVFHENIIYFFYKVLGPKPSGLTELDDERNQVAGLT